MFILMNQPVTGIQPIGPMPGHQLVTVLVDMIFLSEGQGKSATCKIWNFLNKEIRYSILPAISLDGVLHLDILTRSWTTEEFRKFIDALLDSMNPYPQKNSVLIMDNASTHHFDGLREIVEARFVI
jgi:hypothetical protein